jgi:hypothetical protein
MRKTICCEKKAGPLTAPRANRSCSASVAVGFRPATGAGKLHQLVGSRAQPSAAGPGVQGRSSSKHPRPSLGPFNYVLVKNHFQRCPAATAAQGVPGNVRVRVAQRGPRPVAPTEQPTVNGVRPVARRAADGLRVDLRPANVARAQRAAALCHWGSFPKISQSSLVSVLASRSQPAPRSASIRESTRLPACRHSSQKDGCLRWASKRTRPRRRMAR